MKSSLTKSVLVILFLSIIRFWSGDMTYAPNVSSPRNVTSLDRIKRLGCRNDQPIERAPNPFFIAIAIGLQQTCLSFMLDTCCVALTTESITYVFFCNRCKKSISQIYQI